MNMSYSDIRKMPIRYRYWYIQRDVQFIEEKKWIFDFVNYKVGIDGMSLAFILLTTFITPICILATISAFTWGRPQRVSLQHFKRGAMVVGRYKYSY